MSYRTKSGSWTTPERLDTTINTKEIEQRPFVSADNKFLFFSRTSKNFLNDSDSYESDIYWVSTQFVFGPYPYNISLKFEIEYNKPFRIELPQDLFNHVHGKRMTYFATLENNATLPVWINFDKNSRVLSGIWKEKTGLKILITAIDQNGKKGIVKVPFEIKTSD